MPGTLSFSAITIPRVLTFLAAIGFAWVSFADASIAVARKNAPAFVLTAFPDDPFLAPAASQAAILQGKGSEKSRADAVATATESIRNFALNPEALRLLAFAKDGSKGAEDAADLSLRMTRRDEMAQLFKALKSAERNEMAAAYGHFDTAIQTSRSARPLIYPLLANALKGEKFRQGFTDIVADPPEWLPEFLHHLIRENTDPTIGARLLIASASTPDTKVYRDLRSDLLGKLVDANEFQLARSLFRKTAGTDTAVLTSAALGKSAFDDRNSAFGWRIINGSAIGATPVERGSGNYALNLFATSGEKDFVAMKILFLRPGEYELRANVAKLSVPDGGSIQLAVDCFAQGQWTQFGVRRLDEQSKPGIVVLPLNVSGNCTAQRVAISVSGGGGFDEVSGTIDRIEIEQRG